MKNILNNNRSSYTVITAKMILLTMLVTLFIGFFYSQFMKENAIIIRTRGLMRLLILLIAILFTTNAIAQDERNGFYL